jgi:predicted lipoprotein with Yx(FWY)xxD motif
MNGGSKAFALALVVTSLAAAPWVFAQPSDLPIPAATTTELPPGVSVVKLAGGSILVDRQGRTLYGLDTRTVHRFTTNPALYCQDRCAEWEPLLAPPGMQPNVAPAGQPNFGLAGPAAPTSGAQTAISRSGPGGTLIAPPGMFSPLTAPDWGVIAGPAGPQWVYKGWHMVYVRKVDRPRSTAFDGAEEMRWNTLKFVPPVPELPAPAGVKPVFRDGAYALADKDGRLLFTGHCAKDCADWHPLGAGLASQGLGEWTVSRSGDDPQWLFRGKPVFVAAEADAASLPKSAKLLRP